LSLFDRMFVEPFNHRAYQAAHVIPILIMVLVTLIIGGFLAFVARLLTYRLLQLAQFDRLVQRTGFSSMIDRTGVFRSPADLGARFVQALVWLFTVLFALNAAATPARVELVRKFVAYIPNLIAARVLRLLGVEL